MRNLPFSSSLSIGNSGPRIWEQSRTHKARVLKLCPRSPTGVVGPKHLDHFLLPSWMH